jgi:hypothetical protein
MHRRQKALEGVGKEDNDLLTIFVGSRLESLRTNRRMFELQVTDRQVANQTGLFNNGHDRGFRGSISLSFPSIPVLASQVRPPKV